MKRRTALCLLALSAVLPATAVAQQDPLAAAPRMTVAELKKSLDAGQVLVVDVRDAASFAVGHIPGSVLIPYEQIGARVADLKASKKAIVTYCG
jgi:3-mercaptopyruvate sulfurtransferase SseA